MVIDERIGEMLAFAVVNPCTGDVDIELYQRQLEQDLTLTLYIRGYGRVPLTSVRKVDVGTQPLTDYNRLGRPHLSTNRRKFLARHPVQLYEAGVRLGQLHRVTNRHGFGRYWRCSWWGFADFRVDKLAVIL